MAAPQMPELRQQWDADGALHHVWRALSLHTTADCLGQMERADVGLSIENQTKRVLTLTMCRKFVEADRDKELLLAYDELGTYLTRYGLIRRLPPIQEAHIPDDSSA